MKPKKPYYQSNRFRVPRYTQESIELPDPWRNHPLTQRVEIRLARTSMLLNIADQARLNQIRQNEKQYISELAQDIQANGLREPLNVVVTKRGDPQLKNGHHRLLASMDLFYWLPVALTDPIYVTPTSHIPLLPDKPFDWWWDTQTRHPNYNPTTDS